MIFITDDNTSGPLSEKVADVLLGRSDAEIKLFAIKLKDAWRIRTYRQKKSVVTLSVSLNKDVSDKLTRMSKNNHKANIVTLLINENYRDFLEKELQVKAMLEEKKRLSEQNKLQKKSIPGPKIKSADLVATLEHFYQIILETYNKNASISQDDFESAKMAYDKTKSLKTKHLKPKT